MRKIIQQGALLLLAATVGFTACKKKPDPEPPVKDPTAGTVEMRFQHMVGNEALILNTKTYKNNNGDDFTVSVFKYYISNIVLNGDGNDNYVEPESYHLIEHGGTMTIALANVPAGKYKSITYMIGVDSLRNVSGAQTGALSQGNGMFWDWITGYIMAKMEGTSPQSKADNNKLFFHLGGFSGPNNVLKTVALTFPTTITVNGSNPHMHIEADLAKWFYGPNTIDFGQTHGFMMPGANAKKIADNYVDMFTMGEIEQ